MYKKSVLLLLIIFFINGCATIKNNEEPKFGEMAPVPIAQQMQEETIAMLQSPSHPMFIGTWLPYCTAVWIDEYTAITANHCAVAAKLVSMSLEERFMMALSGEEIDPLGTTVVYTDHAGLMTEGGGATTQYKGIVVSSYPSHDLALFQVSKNRPPHRSAKLANNLPGLGEEIATMGHPMVGYSYSHGYVSAYPSKTIGDITGPFIQANILVSPGNSGGGVFNKNGELIGIMSFIFPKAPSQSFAIPLGAISKLLEEYNKNKDLSL